MSSENQQLQNLLDGELADLDLEAVSGGGRKGYYRYCYFKKGKKYCYDRHHG